jgi:hypothetical protein
MRRAFARPIPVAMFVSFLVANRANARIRSAGKVRRSLSNKIVTLRSIHPSHEGGEYSEGHGASNRADAFNRNTEFLGGLYLISFPAL